MCGRYTLYATGELKGRFDLPASADPILAGLVANYNVAPGQILPVITRPDERRLELMRWGLIPSWADDPSLGQRFINARAESLADKPLWKTLLSDQRCLIPANGFYEWQDAGDGKQPFYIRPLDQPLFAFAGLYGNWTDRQSGEIVSSYSIITTTPNVQMRRLHNRMPVILQPEDENRWLNPSPLTPSAISELLRPYEEGKLEIFPVSRDVGQARTNDERLIRPLDSQKISKS